MKYAYYVMIIEQLGLIRRAQLYSVSKSGQGVSTRTKDIKSCHGIDFLMSDLQIRQRRGDLVGPKVEFPAFLSSLS